MTRYFTECSECRFHTESPTADFAQANADDHESRSGHRGPFVWALTPSFQHFLDRVMAERRARRGW